MYALSHDDQMDHAVLVREFVNATHWPKHLLVNYRWRTQHEEDEEGGLLVLFSGGWRGQAGCCLGPAGLLKVKRLEHESGCLLSTSSCEEN